MAKKHKYHVRLEPETLPALQRLAAALGFFANVRGPYHGQPSPAALLDALAAADETAVAAALTALGIEGDGPPPE